MSWKKASEINEEDTGPYEKAMASEKQEAVPNDERTGKADVGGGEAPEGKVQKDATKAVNDPATAIGKESICTSAEISGDAQQKGEGAADRAK